MSNPIAIQIAMKADLIRSDLREGLVWFVNYTALDPTAVKSSDLDLHGAAMLPEDVEKFAHRWLTTSRSIDIEHDGVGRPIHVIESFFNSQDVQALSWPLNTHAVRFDISRCPEALNGMREGTLNSVSLDAYTFNKVMRLPVAEVKGMLQRDVFVPPETIQKWAEELATDGYEGVIDVHSVGPDMYVATRKNGLPLAITVKNGELEASAAGGPWGHIGMALVESPTLTSRSVSLQAGETTKPNGSQGEIIGKWSDDLVNQLLSEYGVMTPGARTDALTALQARLREVGGGNLPADMPITTPVSPGDA